MRAALIGSLVALSVLLGACPEDSSLGPADVAMGELPDLAGSETDDVVGDTADGNDAGPEVSDIASESSSDAPPTPPENDQRFFDTARVYDVRLTLAETDWDALREQARTLDDVLGEGCLDSPATSPFTWFEADATIDGFAVASIGVRKKGFLGSLDPIYPSIKLKLDHLVDGQDLGGMTRMTLNNAKQDPSKVNQCLSYSLFTAAGIPAPRCSYVHLYVNGRDMGLYVHVESIKKPFIRRHFPFDGGNLYEGALSDFRPDWVNTFSQKTNENDDDRSDLDLVVAATEVPDDELLAALDAVIDLDRFYGMWAVEMLTHHQDGYASNANNYYVYRRLDGRFTFIPWGTDNTFEWPDDPNLNPIRANARVARRLYRHPQGQQAMLGRLQSLLNTVWNESALLSEVDRQEALLKPHVLAAQQLAFQQGLQRKRDFIQEHRQRLQPVIDAAPPWDLPERADPCFVNQGTVDITFDTTFGTLAEENIFATGTANVIATIDEATWAVPTVGSKAGTEPGAPESTQIVVAGYLDEMTTPGGIFFAVVVVPTELLASSVTIPINWAQAFGQVVRLPEGSEEPVLVGFMIDGLLTLDAAGAALGAPIVGRMESTLIRPGE